MNISDYHCTLEESRREIACRCTNPALRAAVEHYLGDKLPLHFSNQPYALYWPHIASPNTWMCKFVDAASELGLKPICLEYLGDRFHPGNRTKLHLAHLLFFHGRGRNGGCKTSSIRVADINESAGRRFTQVRTLWGDELVGFHHRLVAAMYPQMPVKDMSEWIESWDSLEAFYDAYMSLCLCHCVLFESFRPDGNDRDLAECVFIPAFERTRKRFGVKPLIVPLEPLDGPVDPYWYCYPESVKPLVLSTLEGFNVKAANQGQPN